MSITILGLTSYSFANDCNLIITGNLGELNNYTNVAYSNVVPQEAFARALNNLKTYCCTVVVPNKCTSEQKRTLEKLYPKSAYLFDHLLDVTMRRLDGVQSLAYGLEPDKAGKARRDYITSIANQPNGAPAKGIEENFKNYRTLHEKNTKDLTVVAKNYRGDNTATLSLADKYNTLCGLLKNVYQDTQSDTTIIGWEFENNSFYRKCKDLVAQRVGKETAYTKLLMIKQSTKLLDETTKAYTRKYFVQEKLMGLRNLITKVKDNFTTIVQQAPASKSCSK